MDHGGLLFGLEAIKMSWLMGNYVTNGPIKTNSKAGLTLILPMLNNQKSHFSHSGLPVNPLFQFPPGNYGFSIESGVTFNGRLWNFRLSLKIRSQINTTP